MRNRLGANVADAPADGKTYGRKDSGWVEAAGELGGVTAADITDATTVGRNVLTAADAAAARTAIGAGTSSLALGTTSTTALAGNTALLAIGATASTAAAGNHNHAVTADAASGLAAAANIQALAVALSARIKVLEDAAA